MNNRELYEALVSTEKVEDVRTALASFRKEEGVSEVPFGGRDNNTGSIEVATDAARSAIERITNGFDAVLEFEHGKHGGKPVCQTPREAASAWLGVPEKDGLSALTQKERQNLAANVVVRVEPGEGAQSRVLSVTDAGCGIAPEEMQNTILSLNESNKLQKHYLAGTYGQGGSSTFGFSKFVLIASRAEGEKRIGFTVVRYEDLPAESYKTGHYVYLVRNSAVLTVDANDGDFEKGTFIRHFGYDLTNYAGSVGPKSLYGALQRMLFDPVCAIRLEDWASRKTKQNRTIKGARNALNGAVDQGDEDTKGPALNHNLPMFTLNLGDIGDIGVEYWVLKQPEGNKNPANAFVDSHKPIILTHNGQNQGELSGILIKKDADLPFLRNRLIVHINCDRLSSLTKRALFSSTREQSREGFVLDKIRSNLVDLLRSDDELKRLNEEAREKSLKNKDEAAEKQMQRQVARLLRIVGPATAEVGAGKAESKKDEGASTGGGGGGGGKPEPIEINDPPTFIRLVAGKADEFKFYAGQRKFIRAETDANSDYDDRINFAVGDDLTIFGTSPLRGGRMRIGVECKNEVSVGTSSTIRVELYRPGHSVLSDEKEYTIVEPPKPKTDDQQSHFPQFKVEPVDGPHEAGWDILTGYSGETDVSRHASGAEPNEGILYVYYSTRFPRFLAEKRRLEMQNPAFGASFQKRYEMWIAVHALLMHQDQIEGAQTSEEDDSADEQARQERCRLASIAAMVAGQEVKSGIMSEDAEEVA